MLSALVGISDLGALCRPSCAKPVLLRCVADKSQPLTGFAVVFFPFLLTLSISTQQKKPQSSHCNVIFTCVRFTGQRLNKQKRTGNQGRKNQIKKSMSTRWFSRRTIPVRKFVFKSLAPVNIMTTIGYEYFMIETRFSLLISGQMIRPVSVGSPSETGRIQLNYAVFPTLSTNTPKRVYDFRILYRINIMQW